MVQLDHELCFADCQLHDRVGGMDATLVDTATCSAGQGISFDGSGFVELEDVSITRAGSIVIRSINRERSYMPSMLGRRPPAL